MLQNTEKDINAWTMRAARNLSEYTYLSNESGIWEVYGEDQSEGAFNSAPNIPFLGYVKGTYRQAVEWAHAQPSFYHYPNRGGTVRKYQLPEVIELDPMARFNGEFPNCSHGRWVPISEGDGWDSEIYKGSQVEGTYAEALNKALADPWFMKAFNSGYARLKRVD